MGREGFVKLIRICLLGVVACGISDVWADQNVNLTPLPKKIQVQEGVLPLPSNFEVNVYQLGDSVVDEIDYFIEVLEASSGISVSKTTGNANALLTVRLNPEIQNSEGYVLSITDSGIHVEASCTDGFFYAFQTLKKMLPANVMAGVKDQKITSYTLPLVQITDEPRFGYRGFMLDVARHFFDVDEVKRVMDMMACYKMNKLHLHLSDDQGFRVEITKYPRLNTIGSIRDDSYSTDFGGSGKRIHTYKPYGPYYYTKEQIRDLVAYAEKLHIDIIPEIDMPGHFGAAMAAYPEFSCEPNVRHPVLSDESHTPTIPNVANSKTLQFTKDILSEIMDLFPYPYIHIGGDECDASHWERNEECMAFMQKMKFSHVRALQSYFTKEMADFVATRGYKLMAWNETITATGSDLDMIKSTGADIVCWTGAEAAAQKAYSLGLSNILAPQPTYYINRKQSADPTEPTGPGNGSETLEAVYNYAPANNVATDKLHYYKGVQACMWTEYISAEKHLEYMAFPRLMAVAESGWSPASKKNFEDFCQRMQQDTVLFNYRDYEYGRHYLKSSQQGMVMPEVSENGQMYWYRLMTLAEDERVGRCMSLLHEGSAPVTNGYGEVNMLWSADPVNESDEENKYQLWAIKESPTEPGKYALVSQALPNGSVNPNATNTTTSGRWTYDPDKVHYNFILSDAQYHGQQDGNYYYSIRSDLYTNKWMNLSKSGQHMSINVYENPADSKAGLWSFVLQNRGINEKVTTLREQAEMLLKDALFYTDQVQIGKFSISAGEYLTALLQQEIPDDEIQKEEYADKLTTAIATFQASLGMPEEGQQIKITNAIEKNITLIDDDTDFLGTSDNSWGKDVWIVSKVSGTDNTFSLKNLNSLKYISGTTSPLAVSSEKTEYKILFDWTTKDFKVCTGEDQALFPISKLSAKDAGKVYIDGVRAQGNAWNIDHVYQVTYLCCDSTDKVFQTCYQSVPVDSAYSFDAPQFKNWDFVSFEQDGIAGKNELLSENKVVRVYYDRKKCDVTLMCYDQYGHKIKEQIETYPYYSLVSVQAPVLDFYTFKKSNLGEMTSFMLQQDTVIHMIYETDAYIGFWELGEPVAEVKDGGQYVFYDATSVDKRSGFLNVDENGTILTTDGKICGLPNYVWTLEASGSGYKVHSEAGKSMPALNKGGGIQVTDNAGIFSFARENGVWHVKDQNGLFWNGNVGSMTGWSDPHPYQVYDFVPYLLYKVTVNYVDSDRKQLKAPKSVFVRAGFGYTPIIPDIEDYSFQKISVSSEELDSITENLSVDIIYKDDLNTGIQSSIDETVQNNKIYDLGGVEVTNPKKGIYIQNKRKILYP